MKSFEYDLHYLQAALDIFEKYLLSDEVFWPLNTTPPPGEPDYPQLTLDGLLLATKRLEARQETGVQKNQLEEVISDLELNRSRWRVAWEQKANRCFRARLRMWKEFIEEYQNNPQENADRYAYEVRLRVMLDLLRSEIGPDNAVEIMLLQSLDDYLKKVLEQASFVWDAGLRSGFPAETYWYLYGRLPRSANSY
jgi:hypothetical protein